MAEAKDVDLEQQFQRAATAIRSAKALVITAGAGMGVDSGLPDFRGPEGFWRAYPPLKGKNIQLQDMSNPQWFEEDPEFAWGFFGHRYNLYKNAEPHSGFQILRKWAGKMSHGHFVFTSNVDGHFQRAGFDPDKVVECHGSIHFLQTVAWGSDKIWSVPEGTKFDVDESTLRAAGPLPRGPPGKENTSLARPNILMFGDWLWRGDRTAAQEDRFDKFMDGLGDVPFVVIEIGSGSFVPTVRYLGEGKVKGQKSGTLIRINPNEPEVPETRHVSLATTGLKALEKIDSILGVW